MCSREFDKIITGTTYTNEIQPRPSGNNVIKVSGFHNDGGVIMNVNGRVHSNELFLKSGLSNFMLSNILQNNDIDITFEQNDNTHVTPFKLEDGIYALMTIFKFKKQKNNDKLRHELLHFSIVDDELSMFANIYRSSDKCISTIESKKGLLSISYDKNVESVSIRLVKIIDATTATLFALIKGSEKNVNDLFDKSFKQDT